MGATAVKTMVLYEYGGPEKLTFGDGGPEPRVGGDTVPDCVGCGERQSDQFKKCVRG